MPSGIKELSDRDRLATAMTQAGLDAVSVTDVTHEFMLEATMLDQPDTLFGFSPRWAMLDAAQRACVVELVRERVAASVDPGRLANPSTALIATATR